MKEEPPPTPAPPAELNTDQQHQILLLIQTLCYPVSESLSLPGLSQAVSLCLFLTPAGQKLTSDLLSDTL